jgi:hypothetical protein
LLVILIHTYWEIPHLWVEIVITIGTFHFVLDSIVPRI